ncbi:MAG: DUF4159 domain-containing protein [Acidobacteriota bacterium]|nr:DUF4159 domain-containing protein [Acidobacteriota bacterium]
MRRWRWITVAIVLALCVGAATSVLAQRRRDRFGGSLRMATAESFDGGFNFCRIIFSQSRDGVGGNWSVDYPRADVNLSIRLAELTRTRISRDAATGEPNHVLLRLTDDLLFQCPFIMMTEVGSAHFSPEETVRLREYLLKGGFLWVDDFWGEYAWDIWSREIGKALPASEYPAVDLARDHPLFRTQFVIDKVPQIPSIGYWYGSGGGTSEESDSQEAHARAIFDKAGRMMVFITHNTDFGDAFEQEATDPRYFYAFSVDGYAFGINVLLYALTH